MATPLNRKPFALAALAAAALISSNAHALLIPLGTVDLGGTGLGAINTILTIQSPASSGTENGMVWWNGSSDITSGSNVLVGASQTQTRTLGDLGVVSADSLRVVFNASEPGNGSNGITLGGLTFAAYAPADGALIFSASLAAPISYANTFSGTGNSGFLFGLDATQATAFGAAVTASGLPFESIRVGLSASASDATGGNETFFIVNLNTPVAAIPEPQNYALLLAGLGAIGFALQRRRG